MCLTVNVPLTENEMTECNNQVQIIFKINFLKIFSEKISCKYIQNKTEYYNCNIKKIFKKFPVCIIYNILNQFIHCII